MDSRRPAPSAAEGHVAVRVQHERELRGWSTAQLARAVTDAGVPLSQSAVWRIENGNPRRKISVDELIGFARVFGLSIDELIQPLNMEYSTDLIRLYVNRWVDVNRFVRHAELRAILVGSNLGQLAARFPDAHEEMREMIRERVLADNASGSELEKYMESFRKALTRRTDIEHLDPTELIVLRRAEGRSDQEIIEEAESMGCGGSVEGALELGITHFIEGDFSGWIPLDFLEVRDGRVRRTAAAGTAAEAAAQNVAQEAGYAKNLGL